MQRAFALACLLAACGSNHAANTDAAPDPDGSVDPDAQIIIDAPAYARLPCDVTLPSATTLNIDSTVGAAGDVICIPAGSYAGGAITNVSDRILQNDGGVVTLTGTVALSGLSHVTISGSGSDGNAYGWLLTGAQASFAITGHSHDFLVHDVEAIDAGSANLPLFEAGHANITWTGSDDGLALQHVHFDRLHVVRSGALFQGNYGSVTAFTNLVSDFELSNIVVENSHATGQTVVGGGGIFNLHAHDWMITAPNNVVEGSADDRDSGVFLFTGSGTVERIHRVGGWGWLVRNFGAELGPTRGAFHCQNNVDLSTEYYGTCEARSDITPDQYVDGKLSTIDLFVTDNVSGHKADLKGYTTAIALIPNLKAATTVTITGNVACNNVNAGGDVDGIRFFVNEGTVLKSNNSAPSSCAGVVDPITGASLDP